MRGFTRESTLYVNAKQSGDKSNKTTRRNTKHIQNVTSRLCLYNYFKKFHGQKHYGIIKLIKTDQ